MRRLLLAAVFGVLVYSLALVSAASISVGPSSLGSGASVTSSCDTDGVTITYTNTYTDGTGYTAQTAEVAGIATACDGLTISVTPADSGGSALGTGGSVTVPGGGAASVPLGGDPPASAITQAFVVIG